MSNAPPFPFTFQAPPGLNFADNELAFVASGNDEFPTVTVFWIPDLTYREEVDGPNIRARVERRVIMAVQHREGGLTPLAIIILGQIHFSSLRLAEGRGIIGSGYMGDPFPHTTYMYCMQYDSLSQRYHIPLNPDGTQYVPSPPDAPTQPASQRLSESTPMAPRAQRMAGFAVNVAGLHPNITRDAVRILFAQADLESAGTATVIYRTNESAARAIQILNGRDFHGYQVSVSMAQTQSHFTQQPPTGPSRGRGGSRGGGHSGRGQGNRGHGGGHGGGYVARGYRGGFGRG